MSDTELSRKNCHTKTARAYTLPQRAAPAKDMKAKNTAKNTVAKNAIVMLSWKLASMVYYGSMLPGGDEAGCPVRR
jgi:hypothetical protein